MNRFSSHRHRHRQSLSTEQGRTDTSGETMSLPLQARVLQRELSRPLHPCGFGYGLEKDFQVFNLRQFAWQMRAAVILSIVLYGAGGGLDYLLYPEQAPQLWVIRYVITLIGIAIVVGSFRVRTDRQLQRLFSVLMMLGAGGTLTIMWITAGMVGHPYMMSLPMIILVGYIFVRLRIWYAVITGLLISVSVIVLVLMDEGDAMARLVGDLYFVAVANLLGLAGGFLLETQIRKNYLRSSLLEIDAVQLQESNRQLSEWSFIDALTGIANRRYLYATLERECARANRDGTALSLLMIDIDHFKYFNDRFGHQVGDEYLIKVANVLSRHTYRGSDLVSRYGGEEFAIVLPDTACDAAAAVAERMREAVAQEVGDAPRRMEDVKITISAGVACRSPDRSLITDTLVAQADDALYAAKRRGRDRVEVMKDG